MSWKLGAGIGFLSGGPVGAAIGGAIQHFVSKNIEKKLQQFLPGVVDRPLFVVTLVAGLTRLSMQKGRVDPKEIQVLHKFFVKNIGYSKENLKRIDEIVAEAKRVRPNLESLARQYLTATQGNYGLLMVALAYQMALVGGNLTREIDDEINRLSEYLQVSVEDHDQLRRKYSLARLKTPHSILGVRSGDSPETIKKAYRDLVRQYHPDKVAHLGDHEVEAAHIRFLEIQSAYQKLEGKPGFD